MKRLFASYNYIILVCMIIAFASCEHKPLYVLDGTPRNVHIVFNWDNLKPEDKMPEGMALAFGGLINEEYYVNKFDLTPDFELYTKLLPCDYTVVSWSNDATSIEVETDEDVEKTIITQVDPDVETPYIYYSLQHETVGLADEDAEPQLIEVKPYRLNSIYDIRVLNANLVESTISWSSTLSGLTNSVFLTTGESTPKAESQTANFNLYQKTANTREAKLSCLGRFPSSDPNILTLIIKKEDGTNAYYKFDVTKQITSAPDPKNVLIEVDMKDAMPFSPDGPDGGEGTINPSIDNFENKDEIIVM